MRYSPLLLAEPQYPAAPVGAFGAPAPFGPVPRRLHQLAARFGLVLVPVVYTLPCVGGVPTEVLTVQPDTAEGPIFVLGITSEANMGTPATDDWEIGIASGARTLVEGRVRARTALFSLGEDGLHAPIVVLRSDTLRVTVSIPGGVTVANEGFTVFGFAVRTRDGAREGSLADRLAAAVRAEGEWYAAGLVTTAQDSVSLSYDGIIQGLSIGVDPAGAGAAADTVRVQIGNLDVTPQPLSGSVLLNLGAAGRSSQRLPFYAGARVTVYPTYQAANPQPVSVVVVGRRAVG